MSTATTVKIAGLGSDPSAQKTPKPKRSRKRLLMVAVCLLLVAAVGYLQWPGRTPEAPPPPGPVLTLESITLNLADGHFLKLGLALQFTSEGAGHGGVEVDGAQALDLAISQLSNKRIVELNSAEARAAAKAKLTKAVRHAYHDTVTDVYFTEFVMQ